LYVYAQAWGTWARLIRYDGGHVLYTYIIKGGVLNGNYSTAQNGPSHNGLLQNGTKDNDKELQNCKLHYGTWRNGPLLQNSTSLQKQFVTETSRLYE
jgi:hypothetical protein